jgi:predicted DNA-binding protein (MmcQ/YjbR family)
MNIEELRAHCLAVRGAEESTPFRGNDVLVFKVMGKMFCFAAIEPRDGIFRIALKCNPARSVELREQYEGVGPSHYTNSLMWNNVVLDSDVPDELIVELLAHSVDLVIANLPKSKQKEYYGD